MLLLALSACSTLDGWPAPADDTQGLGDARIVASPGLLDFGTVSVLEDGWAEAELTLYNLGDAEETISGHDEPIGGGAFEIDADPILKLAAGDSATFVVRYVPDTEQTDHAQLLIEPGDETVQLAGAATAPVLAFGTPTADDVVVGCSGPVEIPLRNEGSEELIVGDVALSSDEFAVVSAPTGIAPGTAETLTLEYTPSGEGIHGASLTVASNDPAHPQLGTSISVLGYAGERVTETFRYTPSNPTDILFLVVTDGGMTAQLDKAAAELPPFVDTLRDTNIDYHLAALSGAGPCPTTYPGWADRGDTSLQAESVLEHGFSGEGGPWDDALLSLAQAALDASDGGCLVGFRRSDADLRLILVADRPASEDEEDALEDLEDRVDSPATLTISGLLPSTTACGTPAEDYADAIAATNGSAFDLCASDWGSAFASFAEVPEGREAVRYALAEEPVASTIEVLAEGVGFDAWSWDPATNEIVFDGATKPALGAELTVRYVSAVACL